MALLGGLYGLAGLGSRGGSSDGSSDGSAGAGSPFAGGSGSAEPGSPGTASPGGVPSDGASDLGPTNPLAVRVDSYYVHKNPQHLTLSYTIGVPECYGEISEPRVEESDRAVTVTLTRVPPKNTGNVACIEIALLKSVDVRLERPLGDRVVLDGSVKGAVVRPGPKPGSGPQGR
jgi:hypothetical protein